MDRRFKDTGSHIGTMYKDLGISMAIARENGMSLFATSTAYELFRLGSRFSRMKTTGKSSNSWSSFPKQRLSGRRTILYVASNR